MPAPIPYSQRPKARDGAPPPPPPEALETIAASARVAFDEVWGVQAVRTNMAYAPLVAELGRRQGLSPLETMQRYGNGSVASWLGVNSDNFDNSKVWADVTRLGGPRSFGIEGDNQAQFERGFLSRQGRHQKDEAVAARGGFAPRLAGSVLGNLADPVNYLPFGAGKGLGLMRGMLVEGALNAGIELAETPINIRSRERLGKTTSGSDVAAGVGAAFLFGGGLHAAGRGAGWTWDRTGQPVLEKVVAANFERLPAPLQRRWAARSTVGGEPLDDVLLADTVEAIIGPERMSEVERGATTGLRRQGAYDAANPYLPDGAGQAAHEAGMSGAMQRILHSDVVPVRGPLTASTGLRSGTVAAPVGGARAPAGAIEPGGDAAAFAGIKRVIGRAESPSDTAKNPNSSAEGRYQFTDGTWTAYYAKVFGDTGESRAAILAKKRDGAVQEKLMDRLMADNAARLRAIGAPVTKENLYILHFAGEGGGTKLLQAGDSVPVREVLGDKVIKANPFLAGMTAGQARAELARRVGGKPGAAVPGGSAGAGAGDDLAAMQRAQARQQAEGELAAAGEALDGRGGAAVLDDDTAALAQPLEPGAPGEIAPAPRLKPEYRSELPYALERVPASRIAVDAETFQFKAGGDAFGVTERLANVDRWQPGFSGRVILWQGKDGGYFVAAGHQRTGLARRVGAKEGRDIELDAYVLREADGISARDARTFAALKNIADDSGTITDMAKVLRDAGPDALRAAGVPLGAKARHAEGAARLSPEAFGAVVNKVIPEEYGALIGARLPDNPELHMAMVKLLGDARPANLAQADDVVRQGIEAGFFDGEQTDMFGSIDTLASLFVERAKVKDAAMAKLRGLKRIFGTAAKEADTLEGAGSKIDVAASTKEALGNDEALALIDKLAWSAGPVKLAIDRAAARLAAGEPLARVASDLASDIRKLDLRAAAMDDADAGGGAGFGSERLEARPDPFEARPLDGMAQAQLARFDNPTLNSTAADAQADSGMHDLLMLAEAQPQTMIRPDADSEPMPLGDFLRGLDEDARGLDLIDVCMKPGGGG